jgi:hypothetical protein
MPENYSALSMAIIKIALATEKFGEELSMKTSWKNKALFCLLMESILLIEI